MTNKVMYVKVLYIIKIKGVKMMKERNYEYLEGKEIEWESDILGVVKAKVAIVDYNIGLTIVANQRVFWGGECVREVGDELTCLNGPDSPNGITRAYKPLFLSTVAKIRRGLHSVKLMGQIQESLNGIPENLFLTPMASCAFK